MFARLGRWCYRRRGRVLLLWLGAFLVLGGILGGIGTQTRSEFSLPDVESRRGTDILEENFGGAGAGMNGSIVFRADQGVDDPQVQEEMEAYFDEVAGIELESGEIRLVSPYGPEGQQQVAQEGAEAGRVAFASVEFPSDMDQEEAVTVAEDMRAARPDIDGVDVYLGGMILAEFEEPSSEILGIAFAMVVLIVSFGSVLAMGLPIGVALAGVGLGTILAGLASHLTTMPDFAQLLGVMIGLGVGIDYALFIVTRFRENLHKGMTLEDAVTVAIDTAGRAVLFAGTTVVISLLGMIIMQMSFITGLAIGAASVVLVTMVASLTLLPALLGFAGHRVEVTRWRGLIAAGFVALALVGVGLQFGPLLVGLPIAAVVILASFAVAPLRREVPRRATRPIEQTFAYKWSRAIQHHPWRAFLTGTIVLGVLAIPVFGLRLGFSDEGNYPTDTDTRIAYDTLAEGFGPGFNGPLLLASELPDGTDEGDLEAITAAVGETEGVAFASPPQLDDEANPSAAIWQVIPETSPQDEQTTDLVNTLRDDVLPAATEGTGIDPAVTGAVAVQVDFADYLADRLLVFFAAVLALSFLLLMMVFRSVLVPLKAVVMNLLSIGAAYGILVAVFQWGWGSSIFGVEGAPIEPFMPMMLFAIVFGLSMDYEVFLLSRVKEEWDRTHDSHRSVADGLAATARVITAAALIMVFVFGSFLLEQDRVFKLAGLGLATAVLLDATIVRMLLVPATMELLGDKNWWVPKWLDRILPRIEVEGHADTPSVATTTEGDAADGEAAGREKVDAGQA